MCDKLPLVVKENTLTNHPKVEPWFGRLCPSVATNYGLVIMDEPYLYSSGSCFSASFCS